MQVSGVDDAVRTFPEHTGAIMDPAGLGVEVVEGVDKRRREAARAGGGDGGQRWAGGGVEKLGREQAGLGGIEVESAHALLD